MTAVEPERVPLTVRLPATVTPPAPVANVPPATVMSSLTATV